MTNQTKIQELERTIIQLPEIQVMKGIWQNDFHEFDVYTHTTEYVRYMKELTSDSHLIIAGYLHDTGKPVTATLKYKSGILQQREPGKPYHEFDNHETIGAEMVKKMPSNLFESYDLSQEKIAKLVGAHYLPMKGIKELRKTKTQEEFMLSFSKLKQTLDSSGITRDEVMLMFLADKLAQGKFCTDREELFAVREAILKPTESQMRRIYELQKQTYGGKE
ncbi:MAG: HD domain-containing protein [archaeon]